LLNIEIPALWGGQFPSCGGVARSAGVFREFQKKISITNLSFIKDNDKSPPMRDIGAGMTNHFLSTPQDREFAAALFNCLFFIIDK
jgi:hypothetical protein